MIKEIYGKIQSSVYIFLFSLNILILITPYIIVNKTFKASSMFILYIFIVSFIILKLDILMFLLKIKKDSFVYSSIIFINSNIFSALIYYIFYSLGYNHMFFNNSFAIVLLAGIWFTGFSIEYYGYLIWKRIK